MKLENQVVSLELAKKLKELGVKQEGAFYWKASNSTLKYDDGSLVEIETELLFGETPVFKTLETWEPYTAFTVAELGEMCKETAWTWWSDKKAIWVCEDNRQQIEADTEADARAKMLIYLLENDLITSNKTGV